MRTSECEWGRVGGGRNGGWRSTQVPSKALLHRKAGLGSPEGSETTTELLVINKTVLEWNQPEDVWQDVEDDKSE